MKSLSIALVLLMTAMVAGCKITPEQSKAIAKNAGMYSAVLWIAADNPSSNTIKHVKGLLSSVKEHAVGIESGKTYMEVVYPEVVKVIDSKIPPQDRPVCKVAAMTLINGVDTLFAMHPEWKKDETLALDIVCYYVDGAEIGLSMDEASDVIKQAKNTANARQKVMSSK